LWGVGRGWLMGGRGGVRRVAGAGEGARPRRARHTAVSNYEGARAGARGGVGRRKRSERAVACGLCKHARAHARAPSLGGVEVGVHDVCGGDSGEAVGGG
jgi:hypothetical protein